MNARIQGHEVAPIPLDERVPCEGRSDCDRDAEVHVVTPGSVVRLRRRLCRVCAEDWGLLP